MAKMRTEARLELVEELRAFLAAELPVLRRYMGETPFAAMVRACVGHRPSNQPRNRWYLRHMPRFLAHTVPYSRTAELSELANLELALGEASDAPDPPGGEDAMLHPSHRLLTVTTNAASLWSSLKCGETPPKPYRLDAPQDILVWKQNGQPRFRLVGHEEAQALANPEADEAAPFIPCWTEAGLLKAVKICPRSTKSPTP